MSAPVHNHVHWRAFAGMQRCTPEKCAKRRNRAGISLSNLLILLSFLDFFVGGVTITIINFGRKSQWAAALRRLAAFPYEDRRGKHHGKKNIDWSNLGFSYLKTDKRFVSNYKDGAWDKGALTGDDQVTINECAGVLQYAQTVFEGMKAYTTEDGRIVIFRPDLNASRMADSARRLEMPVYPEEKFVEAVEQVVRANAAWVPPYGSGATLYLAPLYVRHQCCYRGKTCR